MRPDSVMGITPPALPGCPQPGRAVPFVVLDLLGVRTVPSGACSRAQHTFRGTNGEPYCCDCPSRIAFQGDLAIPANQRRGWFCPRLLVAEWAAPTNPSRRPGLARRFRFPLAGCGFLPLRFKSGGNQPVAFNITAPVRNDVMTDPLTGFRPTGLAGTAWL